MGVAAAVAIWRRWGPWPLFWQDNQSARTAPAPPAMSGLLPKRASEPRSRKSAIRCRPGSRREAAAELDQSDALIGELVADGGQSCLRPSWFGTLIRRIVRHGRHLPRGSRRCA